MNQTEYTATEINEKVEEIELLLTKTQFQWLFSLYSIAIIVGFVLNLLHVVVVLRSKRVNGTLALVIQIALNDLLSAWIALTEVYAIYHNDSWSLGAGWCHYFKGTEILVNTVNIYFLICFNFHTISKYNLQDRMMCTTNRNPLTSLHDESNECLVMKQENRAVVIDYSRRTSDVPVIFPTAILWIFGVSLSIPNYALSGTFTIKHNQTLCAVVDIYYGNFLQNSLIVLKIITPLCLLLFSFAMLVMKLAPSMADVDHVLGCDLKEKRKVLLFAIFMSGFYLLGSSCRQVSYTLVTFFTGQSNFQTPPLYNQCVGTIAQIVFAALHYSGALFRAILYLFFLPNFTDFYYFKVFAFSKKS